MNEIKKNILITLFWILVAVNVFWFGFRILDFVRNGGEIENVQKVEDIGDGKDDKQSDAEGGYYFEQLSDNNKESYKLLLQGLQNRESGIVLSDCEPDEIETLWESVLMDNPDIFWTNSYRYREYQESQSCEVFPDYFYTKDETEKRKKLIQKKADEFVSGISEDETDYNKILAVYEYIIDLTEYSLDAANNQHVDSVLIGQSSVCAGYAKATKYLLDELGIECIYVTGMAKAGEKEPEGHAWNIVYCEGNCYFVDTTWGDPVYQEKIEEESVEKNPNINYDYMCCNEEQLFVTHTLDDKYTYPSCTKLDWNYYVVNERYFTEYNSEEIAALIKRDITEKKDVSVFKFSDAKVYEEGKKGMLEEQMSDGKTLYNEFNNTSIETCYYRDDSERYKFTIFWN